MKKWLRRFIHATVVDDFERYHLQIIELRRELSAMEKRIGDRFKVVDKFIAHLTEGERQ